MFPKQFPMLNLGVVSPFLFRLVGPTALGANNHGCDTSLMLQPLTLLASGCHPFDDVGFRAKKHYVSYSTVSMITWSPIILSNTIHLNVFFSF